ncbi:hypothetical protein [Dankookia sp. P2]|uniref:hypothetical protein n=1 Tax=Dankookia sp. P2 TaxID=3423955 RepID=UPI003D678D86
MAFTLRNEVRLDPEHCGFLMPGQHPLPGLEQVKLRGHHLEDPQQVLFQRRGAGLSFGRQASLGMMPGGIEVEAGPEVIAAAQASQPSKASSVGRSRAAGGFRTRGTGLAGRIDGSAGATGRLADMV